jgi:hypothetical protein
MMALRIIWLSLLAWIIIMLTACGNGSASTSSVPKVGDANPPPQQLPISGIESNSTNGIESGLLSGSESNLLSDSESAVVNENYGISLNSLSWLEPTVFETSAPDLKIPTHRPVTVRAIITASKEYHNAQVTFAVYDRNHNLLNPSQQNASGPMFLPSVVAMTNLADSFLFPIAGEWVESGMELEVNIIPIVNGQPVLSAAITKSFKPQIANLQVMHITVVPFTIAGNSAILPADEDIKATLMAYWPLSDVVITRHAPYTSTAGYEAWGSYLSELKALQNQDQSDNFYVGFIPKLKSGGTVGNSCLPLSCLPVRTRYARLVAVRAPKTITDNSWQGTLAHEMGHALNRLHSPCGTASYDSKYPFASGKIGLESSPWGYDRRNGRLIEPSATYDIMSYCGPAWVSSWSYSQTQYFLERYSNLGGY